VTDQISNSGDPYDLTSINQATLTPVVRQVLNSHRAVITQWRSDAVHGGAGDIGGISSIYRFTGKAQDQTIEQEWTLMLKVVGTTTAQDDPAHPRYWKREVLAYQSGQLTDLPGNLSGPRFFGTHRFSEKVLGLWLESVQDDFGASWSLEHYGTVAQHLGQFNGAFLVERELPSWSWLSRGWLRKTVNGEYPAFIMDLLRKSLDKPAVRRWFIEDDAAQILRLWEDRDTFLGALDRLPQTLLHRDAFCRNLFLKRVDVRGERIIAIDWAFMGMGAIGEELVALVNASVFFPQGKMTNAKKLDAIVFDAYLQGLSDAGWRGDPRLVRLGFTAGSAMLWGLSYAWFDPPEEYIPKVEQTVGISIDEVRVVRRELTRYVLELADEARSIMTVL
jgi:phosphotransferase family enzyme